MSNFLSQPLRIECVHMATTPSGDVAALAAACPYPHINWLIFELVNPRRYLPLLKGYDDQWSRINAVLVPRDPSEPVEQALAKHGFGLCERPATPDEEHAVVKSIRKFLTFLHGLQPGDGHRSGDVHGDLDDALAQGESFELHYQAMWDYVPGRDT